MGAQAVDGFDIQRTDIKMDNWTIGSSQSFVSQRRSCPTVKLRLLLKFFLLI